MVVTNAKWWDGLPPDIKKGLSEAMAEATAYGNKIANDINEGDKKRIAQAGKAKIQPLSKDDVAAWRKAMLPRIDVVGCDRPFSAWMKQMLATR